MLKIPTPSIAVFDSGVGGISVLKEIIALLPKAHFHYFADNAYSPYGSKSVEEIENRSFKISGFLLSKGVDIVVVACNTATSAAIVKLRNSFEAPFVGMEPAIKPASIYTNKRIIAVLATSGTLSGEKFFHSLDKFASEIEVIKVAATRLVPLIEKGVFEGAELDSILKEYLTPIIESGADSVVLGCTHYPLIKESIQKILGEEVTLIDPSFAVAKQCVKVLDSTLSSTLKERVEKYQFNFYTSGDSAQLEQTLNHFLPNLQNLSFTEGVII